MILLDTDIMIDVLRKFEPALTWIEGLDEAPSLPGYVCMELMQGCRSKKEMTILCKSLDFFEIY